ncbi:MAG TPA: DUF5677 domain-containing protein [Anaerolineales bacterium]|nr:DUF5677 domain-containing protein [Anaerolineales bacterium]
MIPQPNFGPYSSWASVKDFTKISEKAFELYHQKISNELLEKFTPTQHLFIRQIYLAETSSFSIRLLTSWALLLQALALTRTRLEHTIITSYLIYEKESKGLEPFVRHISVNNYLNTKAAMSDEGIAQLLDFDISKLQSEAINAQSSFAPNFDINHDKFERKWTKLDLRTMAHHRDKLTKKQALISKDSLERDYVSLYKTSSSIVHSDVSALSNAFMNVFSIEKDKPPVLMPLPDWATMSVAFTSRYDIVQVYEVLMFLGIDCEPELSGLRKTWVEATKKHL